MTDQTPVRDRRKAQLQEIPEIEYRVMPLERVEVVGTGDEKTLKAANIRIGGRWHKATERFWTSFFAKFGFSESTFRYFGHQEVFKRIVSKRGDVELRFCMETLPNGQRNALSVSNPTKDLIKKDSFMEIARKYKGSDVQYGLGVVSTTYVPPSGEHEVRIGPDVFHHRYVLETPLDGYGHPSVYLSLLRQVCLNGAVAYAPAFRQDIVLGKEPEHALVRALESFDSDDGYSALRQRMQAAQDSPASLYECLKLFRVLKKLREPGELVKAYEKVVGDIYGVYGVANLDGIHQKKLRLLPAKGCRVYDLVNLASEASTHKVVGMEAKALQAWVGTTLADEYDLEGTDKRKGKEFEGTFFTPGRRTRAS